MNVIDGELIIIYRPVDVVWAWWYISTQ